MADDRKLSVKRHSVMMEQRQRIGITGVSDVISFDEDQVVAETEIGMLIIRGVNLHVSRLNLENGELNIDGDIDVIMYEDEGFMKAKKLSFFSRLFK